MGTKCKGNLAVFLLNLWSNSIISPYLTLFSTIFILFKAKNVNIESDFAGFESRIRHLTTNETNGHLAAAPPPGKTQIKSANPGQEKAWKKGGGAQEMVTGQCDTCITIYHKYGMFLAYCSTLTR